MAHSDNFNWTNNFNDEESTDIITFLMDGGESATATSLDVKDFDETDSDGKGHANWDVGDKFTIATEAGTPEHTISSIGTITAGAGTIVVTPGIAAGGVADDAVATKLHTYKGKHGSAENHLRLRRQGMI